MNGVRRPGARAEASASAAVAAIPTTSTARRIAGIAARLAIAAIAAGLVACREPPVPPPTAVAPQKAAVRAPPAIAVDTEGGRLHGRVTFRGRASETGFPNDRDPACERLGDPVSDGALIRTADGGVAAALVFASRAGESAAPSPADPPVIAIRNCRFEPSVTLVHPGSSVRVINEDATLHSLVSAAGSSPSLDAGLPFPGMSVEIRPNSPALGYSIRDRHRGWMRAWVALVDPRTATLTDELGHFELRGLADGPLLLTAWHPRLGTVELAVDFSAVPVGATGTGGASGVSGEAAGVDLVFAADAAEKTLAAEAGARAAR